MPRASLYEGLNRHASLCAAGQATRSYLYIDDVVEAYDIILHHGTDGQTYNIGSQMERTVINVAQDVLRHMGLATGNIRHVRDRAFNDRRYFVCDKKLARLGTASPPPLMLAGRQQPADAALEACKLWQCSGRLETSPDLLRVPVQACELSAGCTPHACRMKQQVVTAEQSPRMLACRLA